MSPKMSIRWHGRDARIDERDFESLVRAGLVPDEAWIISPTYTASHAVQADDLEVFHLWRPAPPSKPPERRPFVLTEIFLRRPVSLTLVLVFALLAVAAVLLFRWGDGYGTLLDAWARQMKIETRGAWDLVHLVPPIFVHAGGQHLFGNLLYLFVFGAIVEYSFGVWRMAVIYFGAGLSGGVASYLLLGSSRLSVGASGAIFGLIGATFVYLLRHHRSFDERGRWRARRIYLPLTLAVIAYSILGGNLWAHGAGLVGGAILALVLDRRTRREPGTPGSAVEAQPITGAND